MVTFEVPGLHFGGPGAPRGIPGGPWGAIWHSGLLRGPCTRSHPDPLPKLLAIVGGPGWQFEVLGTPLWHRRRHFIDISDELFVKNFPSGRFETLYREKV